MNKSKLKIHLVQFASINGHPIKTLERVQRLLKKFRTEPGDWVVFPEMWPSGFTKREAQQQQRENSLCLLWLREFARLHRCYMSGSMLEVERKKSFNSAYLISPQGQILTRYRKIHLFRFGKEHLKFHPGKKVITLSTASTKVGIAICYDLRFPELFRRMSKAGAKLILIPSAWPKERIDHFFALLKARAIENQCFIAGANKIGHHESGVAYGGHSVIFGPWGEKLGELGDETGILSVPMDFAHVKKIRRQYPFLKSRVLG
jgi:omega-amidase